MVAQLIVLAVILSLAGLGVFAFRKSRSIQGEVDVALADVGRAVGATFDPATRSFRGTMNQRAVTVKEAAAAAKEHLFGKERTIVLVGNAEKIKPVAAKFGAVTVWKPSMFE